MGGGVVGSRLAYASLVAVVPASPLTLLRRDIPDHSAQRLEVACAR